MTAHDLLRSVRQWWWLLIGAAVLAAIAGFVATSRMEPVYRVQTVLMIGRAIERPNPTQGEIFLTAQLARTYAEIARRGPVRSAVREELGLDELPAYAVSIIADTQLIEIEVTDTDPERATRVANQLAAQLILQSPTELDPQQERRQAFLEEQLAQIEDRIAGTQEDIEAKRSEHADAYSARQVAEIEQEIGVLQAKLNTMESNYAVLLSNAARGALNTMYVIEPAVEPARPIGPRRSLIVFLAIFAAVGLASAAAVLLDLFDDSLKTSEDIRERLDLTTLGAIPVMEGGEGDQEIRLDRSSGIATEAYRMLRTNLQFASIDRPLRSLLVSSPSAGEGKSMTVANLAISQAQLGKRVLVVDCDLHRPRQHVVFGLPNNVGTTTALLEEGSDFSGLVQSTDMEGISVLTSGPLPPNSAELVGSERMSTVLASLTEEYDLVILDSPPINAVADAAILASDRDGVILLVAFGSTTEADAKRAVESLGKVGARLLGVVLNRVSKRDPRYDYGYSSQQRREESGVRARSPLVKQSAPEEG